MRNILTALIFLTLTALSFAETHRVKPADVDNLQGLLARLQSGDTVILERGLYKTQRALQLENLQNVTLRGEGKVEIVLSNLDDAVISVSDSEGVVIKGLRARHAQPNKEYSCEGAVVEIRNSKQVAVTHSELNGCGAAGVYATGSSEVVIYKNIIFNNTFAGVWLYNSTAHIRQNRLFKNAADLITGGQTEVVMLDNKVENNRGNTFSETEFIRRVTR